MGADLALAAEPPTNPEEDQREHDDDRAADPREQALSGGQRGSGRRHGHRPENEDDGEPEHEQGGAQHHSGRAALRQRHV